MASFALDKFHEFALFSNPREASEFLFANPVLLAQSAWPEFEEWVRQCPPELAASAKRAIKLLMNFSEKIASNPLSLPVGYAPLDQIIRRLQSGEITESYAREAASSPDVFRNVSPIYVAALSMRNQLKANNGDWRSALSAEQILLAALDARRQTGLGEQDVLDMLAVNDYIVIVTRSVWEFADGRLFGNAVRRAARLTDVETSPWHPPGAIEFSLGSLYQDPYVYKRTVSNYDLIINAWRRRPLDQLGPIVGEFDAEQLLVPSPLIALTASSKYFLQSADKRRGVDRAFSLKGYISAEVWKRIAGGESAPNLAASAEEAKGFLTEDRFVGLRAEIDSLLDLWQSADRKSDNRIDTDWTAEAQRLLDTGTEELVAKKGIVEAINTIQNVSFAVASASADLAFSLWNKSLPLVSQRDEDTRKATYSVGLGYIRAKWVHTDVEKLMVANSPLEVAEACRKQAAAENWPNYQLAATLLSVAVNSQTGDRETEGVQVLDSIAMLDPAFETEFQPLLLQCAGVLHRAIASNMFYAHRYSDAVRSYAIAAQKFLAINMPVEADEMLALAVDIVDRSRDCLSDFIEHFRLVIPELERQAEPAVVRRIQDRCRNWMPLLVKSNQVDLLLSMNLFDAVKGSAFAAEIRAGGDLPWVNSAESRALLTRIERMQAAQDSAASKPAAGVMDDEILVTLFSGEDEMKDGDDVDAVLHNLQIRYDTELRRQLSTSASREDAWIPLPENIMAVLGPETVLLVFYSGVAPNGNLGLYANVFSREGAIGRLADLGVPAAPALASGLLDALAVSVANTRKGVNKEPEEGDISAEGRKALAACCGYIEGEVGKLLEQLHSQGKHHLCIQPHGPLHFFPFHLLSTAGGILAEQWTVTYLPNLAMLDPMIKSAPPRKISIASFGIEFENGIPHGLRKLPGAEQEARDVASAYGSKGITGGSATETAVAKSLAEARRVHIATHGLHKVSAPSFQRVYLWPDTNSDGMLHAHELLRYDLRGLDLITLSACETALGRVDIGDNCWGLTANALIAGAATVIGTLWPVENNAAKSFFGFLHQKLAENVNKREAFRLAQEFTRSRHPQFRDWGAFCYAGRW